MHETYTKLPTLNLNKDPLSPYWFVTFRGADGKRKRRSTRVPHEGGMYAGERITAKKAKQLALQVAAKIAEEELGKGTEREKISFRAFANRYLADKNKTLKSSTFTRTVGILNDFQNYLEERKDAPIRDITREEAKSYMLKLCAIQRLNTVRRHIAALTGLFNAAYDLDLIAKNPFARLTAQLPKRNDKCEKEAFTAEEISRLINELPEEWSAAVRCCLETCGQRLGDILKLRWEQFDWEKNTVGIVTGKTSRALQWPMRESFRAWAHARYIEGQKKGGDAAVYVLPQLTTASNPSALFAAELERLGFCEKNTSPFGACKRIHKKTFHSLRASCATLLQASGVSEGIAMELVGHRSSIVHSAYIRPSTETLAAAMSNLPTFETA